MGCLIDSGFLKDDRTLTEEAKNSFIRDVKDAIVNGTKTADFPCGEPLPPADPPIKLEEFRLEDESLYPSFHKDILRGRFEATAKKMDLDPSFALLPMAADPIALAGSFGVAIKPVSFPDGFIPYFTGQLPIKFLLDLLKAGVPDFLVPAQLVPELLKLLSIPTPPNLIPDIPIPPLPIPPDLASMMPAPPDIPAIPAVPPPPSPFDGVFSPPGVEPPPIPPIPVGTIPIIPLDQMQTALERELAVVGAIPNLLMKLISEVPKLLTKILVPTEMIPYVCKIVSESGAFPLENAANSVEKAYNAVLSKWFSYFLYLNMIGKTLGSAKGSAVASIAKADPIKLVPPEPEKQPEEETPEQPYERVLAAATAMAGTAWGDPSTRVFYTQNLLYVEHYLSTMEKGSVTINGEFPDDSVKVEPGDTTDSISANQEKRRKLGVTYPPGFYDYASYVAKDASSCGLFARYCYLVGGAVNKFFLSKYAFASALDELKLIGMFKNYKWLNDDGTINQAMLAAAKTTGANFSSNDERINAFLEWDYTISKDGSLVAKKEKLRPHLKDENDLAVITEDHLAFMAKKGEPLKIESGDLILMVSTDSKGVKVNGAEHVAVCTFRGDPIMVKFPQKNLNVKVPIWLSPPIEGVHGGQPDALNKSDKPLTAGPVPNLSGLKIPGDKHNVDPLKTSDGMLVFDDDDSPPRYCTITVGGAKSFNADNYYLKEVKFDKPTAVLAGQYDVGYVSTEKLETNGYYVGRSRIVFANSARVTESPYEGRAAPPETYRKITHIFRTRNFLSPRENGGSADPAIADAVRQIVAAQDEHPLSRSFVDNVLNSDKYEYGLSQNVFKFLRT